MPRQFDEVSWHLEIYLITTNIAIKSFEVKDFASQSFSSDTLQGKSSE